MTISLSHLITSEPNYMSNWGIAYTEIKKGMAEVAVVGTVSKAARKELHATFQPFILTMGSETRSALPLLEGKIPDQNPVTIFVCYNKTCQRPVHTVQEAIQQIL